MTTTCHFRFFAQLIVCYSVITGSFPVPSSRLPSSVYSSPFTNVTEHRLYSEWSAWSSCSSTCGLGIITRTRSCLKRAYNARGVYVPLCHAEYSEHRICNMKLCPPGLPDIRTAQCSRHNNQNVTGKVVKQWVLDENGLNPCELRCKPAESEDLSVSFGKVSSGTPCAQGVCLDGRCLKVGCDGRIGSGVSEDACGVCGGGNATCVHYKDLFEGQPTADQARRNGYHEVVVLPVGSRNLIIRQIVGKNYLALQDHTRGIIFNGEQHLTKYGGHFDIAGTTVQFLQSSNTTETLTAKGPVTEELYVLVLLRNFNQGIYYEYWLPKQMYNPMNRRNTFHHENMIATTSAAVPSVATTTTVEPLHVTPQPHHHHSKPAYAYAYGENPYRYQDAPVFRHVIHKTTAKPVTKQPIVQQSKSSSSIINQDQKNRNSSRENQVREQFSGFYWNFRNASSNGNILKISNRSENLPSLTQSDTSSRGKYDAIISNAVLDEKKKVFKSATPPRSILEISKRSDGGTRDFEANGRLKYSYEKDDTISINLNTSNGHTPVEIALLPDNKRDYAESGKKKRGDACEPCERSREQTKHFCESDFVIRVIVVGYEFLAGETRYELDVVQTFRNTLSLLAREFVWSPGTICRCPRMRPGKEYLVMGRIDNNYRKRESRLLVDRNCYVRTFNLKYARRLQKLKKERMKKCIKPS